MTQFLEYKCTTSTRYLMYSTNKRSTNQFPFIIITTVNIYLLPVQGPDAVFTPRQQ